MYDFFIYLVFHRENYHSFFFKHRGKENSLCTVTFGHMQFSNKKNKVYKVVSTSVTALKPMFSSRVLSVSSTVTRVLGSTANYF